MATKELVLVTGGSGYLGSYCILEALKQGYKVRTTVRSLKRANDVRQMLLNGCASQEQADGVEFVAVDLTSDSGWQEACKDCAYVIHVASPLLLEVPKNADDVIKPAKEGTLRVLKAAKRSGSVKRVVLTSSFNAISYGHSDAETAKKVFTESDWSNPDGPRMGPYQRSKTLAERAAWDWIAQEGGHLELSVINPAGIFGPVLSKDYAASMEIIVRLVNGALPGLPKLYFKVGDVRDIAGLHLRAMTDPKAKGERFIAHGDAGVMSMRDMALRLKDILGDRAPKVPTREMPNFVMHMASWFDKALGVIVPELGVTRDGSNAKAKEVLGWQPRNVDETLKDAAESVFTHGLAN